MTYDDWIFCSMLQGVFGTVGLILMLILAWDQTLDGDVFPDWWTERHAAIITLFLPITWLLALPFWGFVLLRLFLKVVRNLWITATTIERS